MHVLYFLFLSFYSDYRDRHGKHENAQLMKQREVGVSENTGKNII